MAESNGAPRTLAEWAWLYAHRRSWAVFPLKPREKEPATAHGFQDASADPGMVYEMWDAAGTSCNIGLATGAASGVWVLDVDAKAPVVREGEPPGMTGLAALALLEERHGALPETRTVTTSGGGRHVYFRIPEGRTIRNRGRIRLDGVRTGLDVRGEGGYVVLPPSVHPNGTVYQWGPSRELADAPAWLLDLVDPPAPVRAPVAPLPPGMADGLSRFGEKALASACERIATAPAGDRHEAIFRESAAIGELVGGGVIARGTAEAALCAAGEATGKSAREVARTVKQALDKGEQSPRRPEPRERAHAPPGGYNGPPVREVPPMDAPPVVDEQPPPVEDGYLDAVAADEPPPVERDPYRLTDVGNGARLVDRFGGLVRWCGGLPGEGVLCYDGKRWAPDEVRRVDQLAKAVAGDLWAEAKLAQEKADAAGREVGRWEKGTDEYAAASLEAKRAGAAALKAKRWAESSEMGPRLREMMTIARADVAIRMEDLDRDPWALNTGGGVVDLRTGDVMPHRREDYHTKITGASARLDCGPPRTWLAFLRRIMGDDDEMVGFVQRVLGYGLTASIREQCLFVLHGSGSNGKSTFLDTVRSVLGDYAKHTRAETFTVRETGGIPNDIAALRGARVVTASEIKQGAKLDESLIKEMTGDSTMSARFMRGEFFEFSPTWKALWALNHRPVIRGTDLGIWRRIRLIPFEVKIPDEEKDRDLGAKLEAERDAILGWMIQGCAEWQAGGLNPPDRVLLATKEYREDMDVLKDFLDELCHVGEAYEVGNTDLYSAFREWAEANGEREKSQRWFSQALHDRGFRQDPSRKNGRRWRGLALKPRRVEGGHGQQRWGMA